MIGRGVKNKICRSMGWTICCKRL